MGFQNEKIIKGIDKLLILCLLVIIYLAFFSCTTQKKATRYFNENPIELAELCLLKFPISEEYKKGDTITVRDTLKIIDTIPVFVDCPDGTKKECPPKETRYIETVRMVTDTIVKIDTREVYISNQKATKYEMENERIKVRNRNLIYAIIGLFLILVASWVVKK